jgi:anti-sigma factor RsiW
MEFLCSIDGVSLSRFLDGELSASEYARIETHLHSCPSCELRLSQFRLADGLLSRVRTHRPKAARLAASLSVAAALLASFAANALLTPKKSDISAPALALSAAPSETLKSFYEKVAPHEPRP